MTSPPYFGLRDYGIAGQIGQKNTPEEYVERLLCIFAEVNCVLKPEGTLWLNIANSYAGSCQGGRHEASRVQAPAIAAHSICLRQASRASSCA